MPEKRWLILTADNVGFATNKSDVLMRLDFQSAGVFPELEVAIRMTPSEARLIARELRKRANVVQAETRRS